MLGAKSMLGAKRKLAPSSLPLNRRVRPRLEEDQDEDVHVGESSGSDSDGGSADADADANSEDDEDDEDEEEASDESDSASEQQGAPDASSITFGALARAQASLSKSSSAKRPADGSAQADDGKSSTSRPKSGTKDAWPRPKPAPRRTKNAPVEQSSKRPVRRLHAFTHPSSAPSSAPPPSSTRKRASRDPRFDPLVVSQAMPKGAAAAAAAERRARQAYAFLDDYRLSELRGLRAELRDKKLSQDRKDAVRREIAGIESRQKAHDRRELEKKVQEEHRAKERDLASKGKKPYFLKKAEVKKRVLVETFAGMTEKQAEKAIERRRKKVSGKEKKELDHLQRAR